MQHSNGFMVLHRIWDRGRMHKIHKAHHNQRPIYIIDKQLLQPRCKNRYHIACTQVCIDPLKYGIRFRAGLQNDPWECSSFPKKRVEMRQHAVEGKPSYE